MTKLEMFQEFGVRLFGEHGYSPEDFTPEEWPSLWENFQRMKQELGEESQPAESARGERLDVDVVPFIDHVEPLLLHLRNELNRITRDHEIRGEREKVLRFRVTTSGLVQCCITEPGSENNALEVSYALEPRV